MINIIINPYDIAMVNCLVFINNKFVGFLDRQYIEDCVYINATSAEGESLTYGKVSMFGTYMTRQIPLTHISNIRYYSNETPQLHLTIDYATK